MTRRGRWILGAVVLLVAAGGGAYWSRGQNLPEVTAEALSARDLAAIVSASGKIQPQRQINVSANTMGRVTRVAVEEGQRVTVGQFLLEIDPRSLEGQLARGEAGVAAARSALLLARANAEQTRALIDLSRQNLKRQQELWQEGLTARETLERAQNEVVVREADLKAREQEIETREQQILQEQASLSTTRYNLNQIIIVSPMNGIVIRRNIEEGETAVVGTMNNAGTVLLTIADMSVIEAEIEVDETDIPAVTLGQEARITIDAVPNRTFRGHVTEIGNSPIQQTGTTGTTQATTFKVVVTLDEEIPDIRPGFTCTAEITTSTRTGALAVPIQALTVREMLFDAGGVLVHEPPPQPRRRFFGGPATGAAPTTVTAAPETPPGHTREETEGVFLFRDDRAVFVPITTGIAGERYFEVTSGAQAGDRVITGPFASVRALADGTAVKLAPVRQGVAP